MDLVRLLATVAGIIVLCGAVALVFGMLGARYLRRPRWDGDKFDSAALSRLVERYEKEHVGED